MLVLFILLAFFFIFALARRFGTHAKQWPLTKDPRTLVYGREDLQKIWKWEIESGHYPSRKASALYLFHLRPSLPVKLIVIHSPGTDTPEGDSCESCITAEEN
jgi:WD repeat and SOF domain-containing protein 1